MSEPLLALVGPTASGKTEAGIEIAERLGAEIVSIDSMLVYRGLDIGTAKPTEADRARVPHHLIDVVDPSEPFTVQRFQQLARAAIEAIRGRGSTPLLVGGSGLYMRAVADDLEFPGTDDRTRHELERSAAALGPERLHARLADLDPVAAAKIEPANQRRTIRALEVAAITGHPFSDFAAAWERYPQERLHAAGIEIARPALAARIGARVDAMIDAGFVGEVAGLLRDGFGGWLTATQAIGYAEVARHLAGELTLQEAVAATAKRTRNLARRQMAWFAKDPRVRWVPVGEGGATTAVDTLRDMLIAVTPSALRGSI
ncbi:MAG: tRNA (adenosine(37)-N6)-dimethylallyltransferase MiaA [Actinomycetota bacterium]